MKLEELYQKIGGDLKNVMKRIPNEAMIGKFVRKYANDPTYNRLTAAVEAKNWKDAFLAAHTLKGLGENRSRAAAFPHSSKWRVPVPFCASATTWCRKTCRACFSMSAHTVSFCARRHRWTA